MNIEGAADELERAQEAVADAVSDNEAELRGLLTNGTVVADERAALQEILTALDGWQTASQAFLGSIPDATGTS